MSPWTDLRHVVRPLVWDLWIVGLLTLFLGALALSHGTAGHPIRIAAAIVFVLFVPGYAFISALFPEVSSGKDEVNQEWHSDLEQTEIETTGPRGIDGIERLAFGFGLSVALTALIALGLNFTPWGIRLLPLVISLTTFTYVSIFIAGFRRIRLVHRGRLIEEAHSDDDRVNPEPYSPPLDRIPALVRHLRDELLGRNTESPLEKLLTIGLVLSILLAAGSVGWALSTPRPGSDYTEFYLLTEDDEGELVAGNYPSNLTEDREAFVVLTIANHEFTSVTYRVDIRLRDPETNRTQRIQRLEDIRLAHNTTWQQEISITTPFSGTELRVEFLLFRDTDDYSSVYRRLHLIVNVSD